MTLITTLYGAPTGNCIRAAIALDEAAIPYQARHVDLRQGEHRQTPMLSLNPLGKVPVLVQDTQNGPFILTQSNAIIFYADAQVPGRLTPADSAYARARVMERFFYFLTDVIAPSHAAFSLRAPEAAAARHELNERVMQSMLYAEQFAGEADYIAGDVFSLADIAAFTMATSLHQQIAWAKLPNLSRWYQRVLARPAVQKGMNVFAA